ncbi:hypothetical protein RJ639_001356 [Escallonia herrerae]|uniref:Uncharacterized protein n=1 Tax=Escallonia herrerae TaxID=1293975 RepID=A0AA88X9S9_9ASTE|nr:hypothetical protein RJ639_001356 [Escallonia herrerae]
MMSIISRDCDEQTPLQAQQDELTSSVEKEQEFNASKTKVDDIINAALGIGTAKVSFVVVALPEGLALAIALSLAYSTTFLAFDSNMFGPNKSGHIS